MGAPVFWKGKYFITQRNDIHRTSKSKYCTGSKMMTLLPLRLLPRYKRVNPPPVKAINIEAARSAGQRKLQCLQVLQTSLKPIFLHTLEFDATHQTRRHGK